MSVRCKCYTFLKEIACTIENCKHGETHTHWHHTCESKNHTQKEGNREFITRRWFQIIYYENGVYKIKNYKGNIEILNSYKNFFPKNYFK